MNLTLILLGGLVGIVLLLLAWAFHSPKELTESSALANALEETDRLHVEFLPQIRQALAREDEEYLIWAGARLLRRRIRKERRRVALTYLKALRRDFEKLLRTASIIAALSPEIGVGQELERLRLRVIFLWKFRIIQLALLAGYAPLPEVAALSDILSGLSVRLEAAVKSMGERAALGAEMISPRDRSGIHFT